jgi:soluble lytic murein transglycosylase
MIFNPQHFRPSDAQWHSDCTYTGQNSNKHLWWMYVSGSGNKQLSIKSFLGWRMAGTVFLCLFAVAMVHVGFSGDLADLGAVSKRAREFNFGDRPSESLENAIGKTTERVVATINRESSRQIDFESFYAIAAKHMRFRIKSKAKRKFIAQTIFEESRRRALDPLLTLAVMRVESSMKYDAVSNVGAAGLMQIMPATGHHLAKRMNLRWISQHRLFDPKINIKMGTFYIRALINQFRGNMNHAIAAYNWGPGAIGRFIKRKRRVPREYADKVLGLWYDMRRDVAAKSDPKRGRVIATRDSSRKSG